MAIAGSTTATVVADATLAAQIEREMAFQVQSPNNLFEAFAYLPPTLQNTKRWTHNIYARLSGSSAYTETDTVTAQALTPTGVNIDTALYATGGFLGDWATTLAVHPLVPGMVGELMNAVYVTLETDCLGEVSSMTNSTGNSGTTFDTDTFVVAATTFRTQAKRSSLLPLMVLSESARRDLHADVMQNGGSIYGTVIGVELHAAVSGANQGQWVQWGGFKIASTDAIPTVASGKGNFITHMAPGEYAIVLAFSMGIRIEPARKAENVGLYLIASHAHGSGIFNQSRCLRVISKN
jgi:hypothetical protein